MVPNVVHQLGRDDVRLRGAARDVGTGSTPKPVFDQRDPRVELTGRLTGAVAGCYLVTVVYETEHEVTFTRMSPQLAVSRSVSTRIVEEGGQDRGFLWRLNSYWRFAEQDGGVYVEAESISLTRDIPTGLGWLVGPFVTSIPKESLERTLGSTRSAVLARIETNPRKAAASLLKSPKNVSSARMQRATLAPLGASEPGRRTLFSRPESGG